MTLVDCYFWHLVFEFLETKDLIAVAGVCYSWWNIIFRGSHSRKRFMSRCRQLDLKNSGRLYQKVPLQILSRLRSVNLSATTIDTENFLLLTSVAERLQILEIEKCSNLTEQSIFRAKDSLRNLESVDISHNLQFGVLTIACLCSFESIISICFNGIKLEHKEMHFLTKTFPAVTNGDIELCSDNIGQHWRRLFLQSR